MFMIFLSIIKDDGTKFHSHAESGWAERARRLMRGRKRDVNRPLRQTRILASEEGRMGGGPRRKDGAAEKQEDGRAANQETLCHELGAPLMLRQ